VIGLLRDRTPVAILLLVPKAVSPIDFAQILDKELSNLFTAMAFMHFNIGAGLLIILIGCLAMCKVARRGVYAAAMIVLVIANISVSSHLFRRVDCMVAAKKDSKITVPECLNGKSPRTTSGSSARQP